MLTLGALLEPLAQKLQMESFGSLAVLTAGAGSLWRANWPRDAGCFTFPSMKLHIPSKKCIVQVSNWKKLQGECYASTTCVRGSPSNGLWEG